MIFFCILYAAVGVPGPADVAVLNVDTSVVPRLDTICLCSSIRCASASNIACGVLFNFSVASCTEDVLFVISAVSDLLSRLSYSFVLDVAASPAAAASPPYRSGFAYNSAVFFPLLKSLSCSAEDAACRDACLNIWFSEPLKLSFIELLNVLFFTIFSSNLSRLSLILFPPLYFPKKKEKT